MKINIKQLFFVTFIMLAVLGCGQTTPNSENGSANNQKVADSTGNQTGTDSSGNNAADSNTGSVSAKAAPEDCKKLGGTIFQYKPAGEPANLSFTIVFQCKNDSLKGVMFGPVPQGEEGLYYFKSNLDNLQLVDNFISFHFEYGELYGRPFTLANYNKGVPKVIGGIHGDISYTGKLAGDSIIFTCESKNGLCFDNTMVFKKK